MSQENEKLHLVINGVIPSKKNSKKVIPDWKHRRVRLITSPEVQNWEKVVQSGVMGMGKIDGPVKMEIVIYNPDLRKRDLDNQLCSINDAIKGVLFEEDKSFLKSAAGCIDDSRSVRQCVRCYGNLYTPRS